MSRASISNLLYISYENKLIDDKSIKLSEYQIVYSLKLCMRLQVKTIIYNDFEIILTIKKSLIFILDIRNFFNF